MHTVSTKVDGLAINDSPAEMLVGLAVLQVEQGVEMGGCSVVQEAVTKGDVPILGEVGGCHASPKGM